MKLKIVEKGFENYTGMFGVVEFKDGISLDHVNHVERQLLSSLIRVEELEGYEEVTAEKAPVQEVAEIQEEAVKEEPVVAQDSGEALYSREQLEVIADTGGINALREIGERFGVKATSISKLISEILAAQSK